MRSVEDIQVSTTGSLILRPFFFGGGGGGRGKIGPGIHCLRICQILPEFWRYTMLQPGLVLNRIGVMLHGYRLQRLPILAAARDGYCFAAAVLPWRYREMFSVPRDLLDWYAGTKD